MSDDLIPRSQHFDDIYFAVEDGFAETHHVFLSGNNLPDDWSGRDQYVIAETGFGTGLNFLAAWKCFEETAAPHQKLHFISFEKYPLSAAEISRYLSVWRDQIGPYLDRLVAAYPLRVSGWHPISLSPRVTLTLIFDDVLRAMPDLDQVVDSWFLDGHDPAKNPDMWSDAVFAGIARNSRQGTRFATFTAAGFVRRGLAAVGFDVRKIRGFGRKRDMTVGVFAETGRCPDAACAAACPRAVAIIGGGIAGAAAAAALARRGVVADLYEGTGLASAGSGNPRGLFNPRFTAQQGPESDFYSAAFALAERTFRTTQQQVDIGFRSCGSLHLITDDDKSKRFDGVLAHWGWHGDHARRLGAAEATDIAGVPMRHGALYLPDAGMVSPAMAVPVLAGTACVIGQRVEGIQRDDRGWIIHGRVYDAVILANGQGILDFAVGAWWPVHPVRGQISIVAACPEMERLRTNLCYGGYCSPSYGGQHVVGSTFQSWLTDPALRADDHAEVLAKLAAVAPELAEGMHVLDGRASFRMASKDRVPLIGAVPDKSVWDGGGEGNLAGLYVTSAHGSHGLLSAQLGAEILVRQMFGEAQAAPRSVLDHLAPERFLRRERRKRG